MESNVNELIVNATCTIDYMEEVAEVVEGGGTATIIEGTITAKFSEGEYTGSSEDILGFSALKRAEIRAQYYQSLAPMIERAKEKGVLPQDFHG